MTNKELEEQMPAKKMLAIHNTEIAYYEQGEGDAILLLHGWPQTSYVWRKVMPQLADKRKVIAVDLPGLGASGAASNYSTRNIAMIIDEFTEKLKIGKFHLVGHDVGSWVAVAYAIAFQHKLKTLAVIDAGIPGLMAPTIFQPENANKIWQFYFHSVDEMPEFLTKGKEKEYLSWYFTTKSYVQTAINEQDLEVYSSAYKAEGRMKNGFEYYRAFNESSQHIGEFNSTLKLPVFAIGGQYAMADQVGFALKKIASNVSVETIDSCGHYVPEEQPEKLIELIERQIKES